MVTDTSHAFLFKTRALANFIPVIRYNSLNPYFPTTTLTFQLKYVLIQSSFRWLRYFVVFSSKVILLIEVNKTDTPISLFLDPFAFSAIATRKLQTYSCQIFRYRHETYIFRKLLQHMYIHTFRNQFLVFFFVY